MGRLVLLLMLVPGTVLGAGKTLIIKLPGSSEPKSAVAVAASLKLETAGVIEGQRVTFRDLLPDTAYDIKIGLADGSVLQGVDMSWPASEPGRKDVEPLDEEDRQAILELFAGVKAFENRRNMLHLKGDHDRVVILAELIRDNGFYANQGTEVIWRVELWYYKNQHGGWERVTQSSRVLRRERFKTRDEFILNTGKLRYVPALGGLRLRDDVSMVLKAEDLVVKKPE